MSSPKVVRAVLYARYSTDKQSESSIDDQLRVCARLAERHGFTVVNRFDDAALSGGTTKRQGYQRMLEAARRGEFDVIVAEDISRLWRAMAEQAPRLAELRDLDVSGESGRLLRDSGAARTGWNRPICDTEPAPK